MKKKSIIIALSCLSLVGMTSCSSTPKEEKVAYKYVFQDPSVDIDKRVADLVNQMTLEEKISQMTDHSKAIERLGIPEYYWWNEALHGVARATPATVFPQAIGMAATFDPTLIQEVGDAISDEARALHHAAIRKGLHEQYLGLTFWSPNVNIFRDPRWGRGHETYGEDPTLSGKMGVAFMKGLQGDDPNYLKVSACAKHFAVHNGPEAKRHVFNAMSNQKDLAETYLPAFKHMVDSGVSGVMCAYNRVNDEACNCSPTLVIDLLRKKWGFDGYIVSDCGALHDLHANHKVTKTIEESAAQALINGVNVNCGGVFRHVGKALKQGLVTEGELDKALATQLKIRFQLGMFDPEEKVPYSQIPLSVVASQEHKDLARKVARESMVLLKNKNQALPLAKDLKKIYITGNNAADVNALMGNYYGVSKDYTTVLEGVARAISPTTILQYNQTILLKQDPEKTQVGQAGNAGSADATIAVVGISSLFEGENGDSPFSDTGGDRDKIELPANQIKFLKALRKACGKKPLIVVVMSGSAIAMPEVEELADAIVWAWYPGQEGGNAVADVLFGDYSPTGKLPITIYQSTEQLGDYEDYNIAEGGRTYRYFQKKPLYPFGYGLSYNDVSYKLVGKTNRVFKSDDVMKVQVEMTNNGKTVQKEVPQLYVHTDAASFLTPIAALKDFKQVVLHPGETRTVTFEVSHKALEQVNMYGETVFPKGNYQLYIGSCSPSDRAQELGVASPVIVTFNHQ